MQAIEAGGGTAIAKPTNIGIKSDVVDMVVFAVNHRPVEGARGFYRVTMRHGVSRLRSGRRHTLGIIFHDAE